MTSSTIHVLGIGNIGKLVAHALRRHQPDARVTLLFHRSSLEQEWIEAGQAIDIIRHDVPDRQAGIHHELVDSGSTEHITNLVLATKTYAAVAALMPLRARLNRQSTLLFLQNGMGTIDEVSRDLFPHRSIRPRYLAGIVSHGLFADKPFTARHVGLGDMILGTPDSSPYSQDSIDDVLVRALLACPSLNARAVDTQTLLLAQLRKLAVNAVINPLTAIFDCRNGEITNSSLRRDLIVSLVREISAVLQAMVRESTDATAAMVDRVSATELDNLVSELAIKTARNYSSMWQDNHNGRRTELQYMNGYIVKQASQRGLHCPLNTSIMELMDRGTRRLASRSEEDIIQELSRS